MSERLKASSGDEVNLRKIAIYIRWSTEDQGDRTTLEVQRKCCELCVQSQGWQINPDLIFINEGLSGGTLERPGLGRMRQAIKKGLIDVVYELDRLSRNVLDTVNLALDEWEGRRYLKSATQSLDTRAGSACRRLSRGRPFWPRRWSGRRRPWKGSGGCKKGSTRRSCGAGASKPRRSIAGGDAHYHGASSARVAAGPYLTARLAD